MRERGTVFPAEQVVIRNLENRTAGYISLWQSIRLGDGPQDWKEAHMQCFAEDNAFTVMVRLSDKQFGSVYGHVQTYTQAYIDHKYPCGDGGWIHYRVTCEDQYGIYRGYWL